MITIISLKVLLIWHFIKNLPVNLCYDFHIEVVETVRLVALLKPLQITCSDHLYLYAVQVSLLTYLQVLIQVPVLHCLLLHLQKRDMWYTHLKIEYNILTKYYEVHIIVVIITQYWQSNNGYCVCYYHVKWSAGFTIEKITEGWESFPNTVPIHLSWISVFIMKTWKMFNRQTKECCTKL